MCSSVRCRPSSSVPRSRRTTARLSARKLWIAFAAEVMGAVEVDAGAERALTDRPNSLLPAGVVAADGDFAEGDTVDIVGPSGRAFARGLVAVDAEVVAQRASGMRTGDLPAGVNHEVVHRDDLVVLPLSTHPATIPPVCVAVRVGRPNGTATQTSVARRRSGSGAGGGGGGRRRVRGRRAANEHAEVDRRRRRRCRRPGGRPHRRRRCRPPAG